MARILLVSHELSVTGAPNSLLRQAKYFLDGGHEVSVWTYRGGDLAARYAEAGLTPETVADDRSAILGKYRENPVRYDLVVCNTIRTYRCVDVLLRQGLKVAWFVRETRLLDEDYWMNPDFAKVFRSAGNLYAVSEYAADVVRFYNSRVRVVHNAVADLFRGFAAPADAVRFGFIGSLIPEKGIDLLIEAFRKVHRDFPAITLSVAGGIPNDALIRFRGETAGEDSIHWLGTVQKAEKAAFFDAVDVLCVPSLDEPFGLTVAEGAMHGKAIITTDRTGANFLVGPENGRIVHAGDADALAAALADFAAMDSGALHACAESSRAAYLAKATPDAERAAVLRLLDETTLEPPPRGRLPDDRRQPLFHETRYMDGRRVFYLKNLRLMTIKGNGVRRR